MGLREALIRLAHTRFEEQTRGTPLLAPISPSPLALINKVLDAMEGLSPQDTVVDLGCGEGLWLRTAAARFGCLCRGYDINSTLIQQGKQLVLDEKVSPLVQLEETDLFDAPLGEATLIIAYLFRDGLAKVREKLLTEMAADARLVCVGFQLPDAPAPDETVSLGSLKAHVYLATSLAATRRRLVVTD